MIELKKVEETVILTAVCSGSEEETAASLRELEDLVSTAGAKTLGVLVQNRENVHPGTYLGKGKLDELREMIWEKGATGIVCDDELSPAQLRNLEEALDTKVMDRTMVIWIYSRPGPPPEREKSRWSWPSCATGRSA